MKPVIIIAIAFVLLIPLTVYAQEYLVTSLIIPDRMHSYSEVDTITVSGEVVGITGSVDEPVTMKIFYYGEETFRDNKKRFITEKVIVSQDGSFTKTFDPMTEDNSWRQGYYSIELSIGSWMSKERLFSFDISNNLNNGCPRHFPDIGSDGLCFDDPERCHSMVPYLWSDGVCHNIPEPEPVGMRWHQNELYDYSFDIPTDWAFDEKYVSTDGTTIGTRLWPEQFYPPPSDITVVFENLLESDVPELNSEAIENYLRDSVLTIPGVRIIDSYSQNELWGWTATVEIRYIQSNSEPHEIRKAFVFEDRETYFVNFGAANEEEFDEYYPVYQGVLENLVIKSVTVPEFGSIAMLILVSSIIPIILVSRKFEIMK